ncbi:hypothetical protein [Rhizobium sp. SL42]|uniref:hypothetical protein n=1 Tax=Rhizobium sp. SL42 TaxID=2806346 RepID=UPI001F37A5B8|nr:hypothetical protein [Rhizobium sp. SL42]
MTKGTPGVDLAALIELNRLVTGYDKPTVVRSGRRITQEDHDEIPQYAHAGVGPAARPDIENPDLRRTERQGSQEGDINAGLGSGVAAAQARFSQIEVVLMQNCWSPRWKAMISSVVPSR